MVVNRFRVMKKENYGFRAYLSQSKLE